MATSRKGTNFKEFAATLRYPPLRFEDGTTTDPLQTPRAQFLKDFATNVLNDILRDIKEDGLEYYANQYNEQPFKNYAQKVKEDELLKNPINKAAKAALVDQQQLHAGDPYALVLNDVIDSFTDNVTFDTSGVFAKGDTGALARKQLLDAMGVNSLKLLGFISLTSLARSIPIETITQFNVQEYLKYLDPVFLLNKLIAGIKDKSISEAINDFKLVGRFVNGVLTSSQFEPKLQQAYLDYLSTREDIPASLQSIAKFDEIIAIVNPDNIDEQSDEEAFKAVSTASIDFLQNGKLGIDLKIVSRDLNGSVLGEISLNDLSEDMTGLITGAQDDLQKIFDGLENRCDLPDANMFNKYRNLGLAIKQFFQGFKPIRLKKTKLGKIKIADRHELIESALASVLISSFYVATTTLFKLVLSYLQKLVPDLSCAEIAAMIVPEEELGPATQNRAVSSDAMARKIAASIKANNPNNTSNINIADISALLAEIASSIGMFNGMDINSLNEFLSLATSVLTEREYCELLGGNPTQDTILIIQNIIDFRYPQAGISKDPQDITAFFKSLSSLSNAGCDQISRTVDMPVNTLLCATPEYYRVYNDLRIALLKEKGLADSEVELQINKICDLNSLQAQQFLDLLNNDDPLDSMIPLIQTGNPNCGIESSIEPINELVKTELVRSYTNIFEPLKESLDLSMVGDRGFITKVLSGKNGLPYPLFLQIAQGLTNALTAESYVAKVTNTFDPTSDTSIVQSPTLNTFEPSLVASWMRLNQEEFCSLDRANRLAITPFTTNPQLFDNLVDPFNARIGFTDEDKERLRYFASLTNEDLQMQSMTFEQLLTYEDLFKRLGNIFFSVRGLSFTGIYDLSQSSIENLSVDGIRQANLEAGAFVEVLVPNKNLINTILLSMVHPVYGLKNAITAIFNPRTMYIPATQEQLSNKNPPALPGVNKKISSKQPLYRVKSYNFFIMPLTPAGAEDGLIRTKIIDYYPSSIRGLDNLGPNSFNENPVMGSFQTVENLQIINNNKFVFDQLNKRIELKDIVKKSSDYFINVKDPSIANPSIMDILPPNQLEGASKQSLVFADLVLKAIQDNVGINFEEMPDGKKYAEYIQKELYNYVYNSFMDGMNKIPALNGKNLNFGVTDQRINPLNSFHTNTITGYPDPVNPEDFGGTETDPAYYIYNKLSDDWKNLYNLYVRDRNEEARPARTPIPDFAGFSEQAADLYLRLSEETREANDYSNQAPFDLIVSKASLVTMDSLVDMMIKVFSFEHYYKGFAFLNTVEITDNVFDNVFFTFLANRFKDYAVQAGPTVGRDRRKTSKFYHMLMEMYVSLMFKKREARILSVTPREDELLRLIGRKTNIWRFGIPKAGLTDKESQYLEASSIISQYEQPSYPIGTISNAVASSQNSLGPMNKIFAEAKKQRQEQIRIRNNYWNLIMEDCEPLFEELLSIRLRSELNTISNQLAILNPDLIKENSILNMPINGGPIVQNGEKIPDPDGTAYMRNIYSHHPAMLYSAGNVLISDYAYRAFYGTLEDNNDRNFNGFLFNKFYTMQPHPSGSVVLKSEPKEPVYSFSANYDADLADDIGREFRSTNPFGGSQTMDMFRYSPDFLTPSVLNYIELNKRDIVTNEFLLKNEYSKAGYDSDWNSFFLFQDEATRMQEINDITNNIGNQRINDYLESIDPYNQQNINFDRVLRTTENPYHRIKRFKVFKTDGTTLKKLGTDTYIIGGMSASNMPIVLSQVGAPIVVEQYINLDFMPRDEILVSPMAGAYIDRDTGQDVFLNLHSALESALYNTSGRFTGGFLGDSLSPTAEGIFRGPSSLTNLIYWLGASGFLNASVAFAGQQQSDYFDYLDFKLKDFFRPGTFNAGLRLMLLQPDSNLTIDKGLHSYFEDDLIPVKEGDLDPITNIRDRIKNTKSFSKETGYSIPIFKAEESVEWTLRDLKAVYDAYISSNNGDGFGDINVTPTKWIDHSPLTRMMNIRLSRTISCSEEYKKMFDFCVPLRYMASLTAIYTTKAFTNSIGSAVDWGGIKRVDDKVFKKDETNVLAPFYESVRKVFYHSYNSFDPSYNGENDDNTSQQTEEEKLIRASRPLLDADRGESIVKISEIQNDILHANKVDPLFREGLGDLRSIIGTGYERSIIPDPTNACGSANDEDIC